MHTLERKQWMPSWEVTITIDLFSCQIISYTMLQKVQALGVVVLRSIQACFGTISTQIDATVGPASVTTEPVAAASAKP